MIKSQQRLYSQQRLSLANWRRLESSAAFDFDSVLRNLITGTSTGYIVAGMKININSAAFSADASNLTLNSANSVLLHSTASESGTILNVTGSSGEVLNSTNTQVIGGFASGSTNYVGIEFVRVVDEDSAESIAFWDADSSAEFTKVLPVSTVLDYRIVINQSGFGSSLPVAVVVTSSGNVPTAITDARQLLFRLGTGGATPNPNYNFPWTSGRSEAASTSSSGSVDSFSGGDKQIGNFRQWIEAIETTLKEIKGTTYWFEVGSGGSGGSTGGLSLFSVAEDSNFSYLTGEGVVTHSNTVTGNLAWTGDLYIRNIIDPAYYKIQSNPSGSVIPNNGVLAVNLTRYQTLSANITFAPSLASQPAAVQSAASSVTTRVIKGNAGDFSGLVPNQLTDNGSFIKVASDSPKYYVQVSEFYDAVGGITSSANGLFAVLANSYDGSVGAQTLQWQTTYYTTANLIVTAKNHVLDNSNLGGLRWIAARNDMSTRPVIYLKDFGELQMGESRQVNDNTTENILQYVGAVTGGATNESLTVPLYNVSITGAVTSPAEYNYPGLSTDNLTDRVSYLSSAMANKAQDKNISLVGGGELANSAGSINWSQTATLIINGPGTGTINTIPSATVSIPSNATHGGSAYVTFNRNVAVTLSVSVTTNNLLPLAENVLVIARRAPSSNDIYAGIDGQALLVGDGTSNVSGFNPATATSLGIGNMHRWNASEPTIISSTATVTYVPSLQNTSQNNSYNLYSTASLMVFRNGLLERRGYDYDIDMSSTFLQVQFNPTELSTGDELFFVWPSGKTVPYTYVQESFTQSVTANTTFTLSSLPGNASGVQLFVNGLQREYIQFAALSTPRGDFSVSGSTVTFTSTSIPDYSSLVTAYYTSANDNLYPTQTRINSPTSPNGSWTKFIYTESMVNLRSAIVSVNGVAQNSVQSTATVISGIVSDYVWSAPDTMNFSLTGWSTNQSVPTGAIINIWSR